MLPVTNITRSCYFSFRVFPHVQPGLLVRQRLHVAVNGYPVARFSVSGRRVVAGLIKRRFVRMKAATCLRLSHPDHARPIDFPEAQSRDDRPLGVAYEEFLFEELNSEEEALAGALVEALEAPGGHADPHCQSSISRSACDADSADILKHFQSAGDDCEFGFLQREVGLEPLGLLRFASISIDGLTRGLRASFKGIGDFETLDVFVPDNAPDHDYMVHEKRYGLIYHTRVFPQSMSASDLKVKEVVRLKRLAEMLIENIQQGDKIFVIKYKDPPVPVQLARLLAAFRKIGDATICWVRETSDPKVVGTAEWLLPGLIVGYVDRIDVSPLQNISVNSWVEACRAAHRLWVARRGERKHP